MRKLSAKLSRIGLILKSLSFPSSNSLLLKCNFDRSLIYLSLGIVLLKTASPVIHLYSSINVIQAF